jgi:general secretion pathway protein D
MSSRHSIYPNLTAPTELQDVVSALRSVLDVSRVQQLVTQEAIVIRGTPDQILLAEKMVNDFDQAAPEVVVDLAIMQVSRDNLRTLGINPPTSATVQLQSNTSSTSSSVSVRKWPSGQECSWKACSPCGHQG